MRERFRLSEYDGLLREVLDSGGEFRIYPRGTSMLPLLREGKDSVVLIKPLSRPNRKDIVLYQRTDGDYVLHRIIKRLPEGYIMCGDNQTVLEPGIRDKEIIGVVLRIYRGEKQVNRDGILYRAYVFLWQFIWPRRVIHKLMNILSILKT